jgi:hypothetical protein
VCLCVHRGECSYVYNYLGLYVFLKKEMISRAYIQIRTIVVGPVRRLCLTGVASPCMQDYNNNRTRLIDDQTSRSRHVHGMEAKNGGELFCFGAFAAANSLRWRRSHRNLISSPLEWTKVPD